MRCLKAFGERISARDRDRQTAEIQIRIALMNRISALGTAASFASADAVGERGYYASAVSYATTPRGDLAVLFINRIVHCDVNITSSNR